MNKPLMIVVSSTRNYGWVTRAFLEGNTRWADYIVIVDQMSTDATRPLIEEYNAMHREELGVNSEGCIHRAEIVILDDPDMSYKENIRAKRAFMKGRQLAAGRDAIYFALDIDEVMPANWMQTEDGKKIQNSQPGDMFQIEWANIMPGGKTCTMGGWQYKVFHDNGMDWQEADIQMHTPLLPYSSWDESLMNSVHDFPLLHFGRFNEKWIFYKGVYYQFLDMHQKRSKSVVSLYRTYHSSTYEDLEKLPIDCAWLFDDVDLIGQVDVKSAPIFFEYIKELIAEDGIAKFQAIDVWTDEFCELIGEKDPRSLGWRLLHKYLRATKSISRIWIVKGVDKILKKII